LIADAILDASARGDIILDIFLGSGTTVLAAERTGRRCYGLEPDPRYADTVVRRWQAFTGESARHAISASCSITSEWRWTSIMADESKRTYDVGYGKPPRHSRFKKGRSGNPHGRPQGSRNMSTLLDRALNEQVVVSENGKRKTITKRDAV
jgi:hypothetical protein